MFAEYFSLLISNSLTRFLYPTRSMIGEMAIWLSILALGWRSITFSGTFIFLARISLSLSNTLFGFWEMKGKKWFFLFDGSFVAEKMKGKGRKRWFLNFFFFFKVDNFKIFSFFVWLSRKKKTEKKKVFFFFSLWLCLVAEKWILWRENERKEQEKWFLYFLIFVFKVFNKLFIYLGHIGLNRRVTN